MEGIKRMSNIQRELLKIYSNDISEEQLLEIRKILGRFFAGQATELMDAWAEKNGVNEHTYDQWTREHNRKGA